MSVSVLERAIAALETIATGKPVQSGLLPELPRPGFPSIADKIKRFEQRQTEAAVRSHMDQIPAKKLPLGEMFTDKELAAFTRIVRKHGVHLDAVQQIADLLDMKRVDAKTGQENDRKYIAYATVYAISEMLKRKDIH